MASDPHQISVRDAAVLTQRWRNSKPPQDFKGACFERIAFDNLLSQPKCTGIRIYMGLHLPSEVKENEPLWTFVMIGTDSDGNDIIPPESKDTEEGGGPEQNPHPCPPYCSVDDPLNWPP